MKLDDMVAEQVLRFGTADIGEKYLSCIKSAAQEYCAEIFETLKKYEYNSELMRLFVTGGGGCILKNFGEYDSNRVTIIDDICAAAKGYEQLAYITLRKRTASPNSAAPSTSNISNSAYAAGRKSDYDNIKGADN